MKRLSGILLSIGAIAANCSTATAGTVTVTPQIHSAEGLNGVTAIHTTSDIQYQLGATYWAGDKITFSFPTGTLDHLSVPTSIHTPPINSPIESQAKAGITMGLLAMDSSKAVYRVTQTTLANNGAFPPVEWQNSTTNGNTVTFPGFNYSQSSLLNQSLSVTVSSSTAAGDVLDSQGNRTATLAEAKSQFGAVTITRQFDAVIDQSKSLNLFEPNAPDTLTWNVANVDTTGWLNLARVENNGTVVTVTGEAGKFAGLSASDFSSNGSTSLDNNTATVSMSYNGKVNTDTLTFTPPGSVRLEPQNFTSRITYNYISAASVQGSVTVAANQASGAWTATGQSQVTVSTNSHSISEAGGSASITASLSNVSFEDVTVGLSYSGTATSGSDYSTSAASIVIPAGQLQGSISLQSLQDTDVEINETIIVDISSVSGGAVTKSSNLPTTITLRDDDTTNVALRLSNSNVAESRGTSIFTAAMDKPTFENVTVFLAYTGTADSNDYELNEPVITIAAGQTTGSITLTAVQDSIFEGTETVVVDIASVSGGKAVENGTQQQSLSIIDDDFENVLASLSVSKTTLDETSGTATVTVSLDKSTTVDVTVALTTSGSATNGSDYRLDAETLVISAGQTTAQTTVRSLNDSLIEEDETIVIEIANVTGGAASEAGTQRQTLTITNDDFEQTLVSLAVGSASMVETSGQVYVEASLDKTSSEDTFVYLSYAGSAVNGVDYQPDLNAILIAKGKTSGRLMLNALSDEVIEGDETIVIDIADINGLNPGVNGNQQKTLTIKDDDFEPVSVSLQVSADSIGEAGGEVTITALLNEVTGADVSVSLFFSGTAMQEFDFNVEPTTIVIPSGTLSASTKLTAKQDADVENNETIVIDIVRVDGANASENGVQQQTLTLVDDDFESVYVSLHITPDILTEAGGYSMITVALNKATFEDVKVDLVFSGNAVNTDDYSVSKQSITIAAGQTTGSATIAAVQDVAVEGLESIIIDIDNVSGGNAFESGFQQTSATIIDDDIALVRLNVDRGSISELGGTAQVSAVLDKVTYQDVVVGFSFAGNATNGTDYTVPAKLTIPSGQKRAAVTLAATEDNTADDAETVIIDIASVSGGHAYESGHQQAYVSLFDNALDTDRDGIVNTSDNDDDNDGTPDSEDAFPLDAREDTDSDGDGIGDNADTDDDNDGVPDATDDFPNDATRFAFTMLAELTVEDSALANCLDDAAARNGWNRIDEIVSLDCANQGIGDLRNVERFSRLQTLKLAGNQISDLTPLSSLVELTSLDLRKNAIEDINALASLIDLTTLKLSSNQIEDISVLKGLTQLRVLSLANNQINDKQLSVLADLQQLTVLYLRDNFITDLTPLSGLNNLTKLYLSRNQISDIAVLAELTELNKLELDGNRLTDISALFELKAASFIKLVDNNEIACGDVDALASTLFDTVIVRPATCIDIAQIDFADTALGACVADTAAQNNWTKASDALQLSCADQGIESLKGLEQLSALQSLDLRRNHIVNVAPLRQLTHLTTLKLSKNQVSNINPLSALSQLRFLSFSENDLAENNLMALKSLNKLETLYLRNNQIQDISVLANLTGLLTLKLEDNDIVDVTPLFKLENATSINLQGNDQISCRDLEQLATAVEGRVLMQPEFCIN